MVTKLKIKNKIQYAVTGILGENATSIWEESPNKSKRLKKTIEENGSELMRFFDTEEEANAYIQGLNDMCGNNNYVITDISNHEKVFGKIG